MRQSKWAGGRITEGFLTDSHIILSHPCVNVHLRVKDSWIMLAALLCPSLLSSRDFFVIAFHLKILLSFYCFHSF